MSYIYEALKPYLCTHIIRMIEDMVRWDFNNKAESNKDFEHRLCDYVGINKGIPVKIWQQKYDKHREHIRYCKIMRTDTGYTFIRLYISVGDTSSSGVRYSAKNIQSLIDKHMDDDDRRHYFELAEIK